MFQELEHAIFRRDSSLTARLQRGLSETQIRRRLGNAKVSGNLARIVQLYSWKNGVPPEFHPIGDGAFEKSTRSFLPRDIWYFTNISRAIADYQALEEVAVNFPIIREAVGRYFPVFWNGDVCWLAVDLQSEKNRVILLDWRQKQLPFSQTYDSFEECIKEFTRAHIENVALEMQMR